MRTLPRTSEKRREKGQLRLLTSVDVYAPRGLQFRGQSLSPGAQFEVAELPRPAVLLECAGSVRIASGGSRYAFKTLWLLWDFDFAAESWTEVVRAAVSDASWTTDFAPIANRLLNPVPQNPAEERSRPLAEQLTRIIHAELDGVKREERCYVLASLQNYLANEIVRVTDDLSIRRKGMGKAPEYSSLGAHFGTEYPDVLRPRPA